MKFRMLFLLALFASSCSTNNFSGEMPTPEQMSAAIEKASKLSKEHEFLSRIAGSWVAESKMWMDPSKEPEVTQGKQTNTLVIGNRYLETHFQGVAMGKPFEGKGHMGFSNTSGKYFTTWVQNQDTALMTGEGIPTIDNNVVEIFTKATCPVDKKEYDFKDVYTIIDANHYKYEMFFDAGGTYIKSLEVNYTRAK